MSINDHIPPARNDNGVPLEAQEPILQFFEYQHLRPDLQPVSMAFHQIAIDIVRFVPRNPERIVALRKLLEAQDCAVRAAIYKDAL